MGPAIEISPPFDMEDFHQTFRARLKDIVSPPKGPHPTTGPLGPVIILKMMGTAYWTSASSTPAATAEPITPATLGPMACIRRKLWGFDS